MSLLIFNSTNEVLSSEVMLERLINEWENKYLTMFHSLCTEYDIDAHKSTSSNDSDSENYHSVSKIIKEAIRCKAYIDVEYKAIQSIRSELEDCSMVKELTESLQQLGEDKELQSKEIEKLRDKNSFLQQEKERLERCLRDVSVKSSHNGDEQSSRATIFAEKLDTFRNRGQSVINVNQNSDYCHIAPTMNIFSDSEHSVSEEDSLEKDRKNEDPKEKENYLTPLKFNTGISRVSKSTPIKNGFNNLNSHPTSRYTETQCNLTQDLKDIQKYFNGQVGESCLNQTSVIDWDMSQQSFEDSRERIVNDLFLQGRENPIEEYPRLICNSDAVCSSQNVTKPLDIDTETFKSQLKQEKDKYDLLSNHITRLYDIVSGTITFSTKQNEVPTSSGDQPRDKGSSMDPVEQICYIQGVFGDKCPAEKTEFVDSNVVMNQKSNHDQNESDESSLEIFKSLSEASVRLLTEIVNSLFNIDVILSERKMTTTVVDNTSLVMDYLQYLISLKCIDFSNEDAKRHPIYELVKDLENNVQCLLDKLSSSETEKNGLSKSLESFYQEQLKKCYDDISDLKQQLESTQQLLTNKMPMDTAEDFQSATPNNLTLFEVKQKLQEELKGVDREYSRQMIRERKRLEESEGQYSELLSDYENMQKKYIEELTCLKLSIDHMQRQHDDDKKFIDQQNFEWELERSQHNVDIENLNKTIVRIKRSSSFSDSISDSGESCVKSQLKKSNSLPKSKSLKIYDMSNAELTRRECSSQTIHDDIIVLLNRVSFTDLEKHEEFKTVLSDIRRYKGDSKMLLIIVRELSYAIFDVFENEGLPVNLPNLLDLIEKDCDILPKFCDDFWEDAKSEVGKIKEFLMNFMRNGRNLMFDFNRVHEELESNLANLTIKQDQINALEEEVHSLMDFQKNLSKDYELVQSMLEAKQITLDELSNSAFSGKDEYEENLRKLQRELIEKQNIIDERDEDLYVIKEEKENMNQERLLVLKQYEADLDNHRDMYQDLEYEMKEYQITNRKLQEQIKEVSDKDDIESSLRNKILDLTRDNENLKQKLTSFIDENHLSELRLVELEHQYKDNVEKLTRNLEETERANLELLHNISLKKESVSNFSCQVDHEENDVLSHSTNCHSTCVSIQEKLSATIEELKKEHSMEKNKREEIETKHRQFLTQYDALSNKVFSLETSVGDPKYLLSCNNDIMNESVESFDRNTFMHASQISLRSFDEDVELHRPLILNGEKLSNGDFELFKSVACQTVSDVSKNLSVVDNDCSMNISDWLADLLNEVENVLQTCVIGDNVSIEVLAKVSKFRHLLEQMYKRQLAVLLTKISTLEKDVQTERKNNIELSNKANFLMTEVQESESVQRNLKCRLDQVLSENSRVSESYRTLSDKSRSTKINYADQINKIKDELESEKYKFSDSSRQLKNEQRRREQLESALLVANERIQLMEQSNIEMIKKSRQQNEYQQKEIDAMNSEYTEMFRRCNEYKLQIETLQQNLHFQTLEAEKTKNELRETIQSNTEYRTKMNEFIKIYQGKRSKLEIETKDLQQLLQISCRREITFIKENETLRMKAQVSQSVSKEYDRKIRELENCISSLHQRHEDDRFEWLKMINSSIDKKKDDGVLSQVNWLLKMLQLRIELLGIHYVPPTNYGSTNIGDRFECSVSNTGNSELVILLQSIKSIQSMISVYLSNYQDVNFCPSSDAKIHSSGRSDRQHSVLSKRPKPTGSSDSLDSLTDGESNSAQSDKVDTSTYIESINSKIYVLQMNKIVELQISLNRYDKWRQCLLYQKKFILSHMSQKQRSVIEKPILSEEQKIYIKENFFKFKFRSVALVIIALQRFSKPNRQINNYMDRSNYVTSSIPFPTFSTDSDSKAVATYVPKEPELVIYSKAATPFNRNICERNSRPFFDSSVRKSMFSEEFISGVKTSSTNGVHYTPNKKPEALSNPVHSVSPILERSYVTESSSNGKCHRTYYPSSTKHVLSNSYSNCLRSSKKSDNTQNHLVKSLDRKTQGKTINLSSTIRQIDDFGKRLDKYTDRATDH